MAPFVLHIRLFVVHLAFQVAGAIDVTWLSA